MRYFRILIRVVKAFPLFFRMRKEFNCSVALWMCYVYVLPSQKGERYFNAVSAYFSKELSKQISAYRELSNGEQDDKNQSPEIKTPVWTCWLTGSNTMPDIVKLCYHLLQRMIPDDIAELKLITENNYREYVEIPNYIAEKYAQHIISPAHFSDIIRFCLLSKYGGMWLDSTVYTSAKIPNEYIQAFYYTQKVQNKNEFHHEPSKAQWCGFIWACKAGNPLFAFIRDALFQYWKEHNTVIDYIFFDYIIISAYQGLPEVKRMIDEQEPNNEKIWDLWQMINSPFDDNTYKSLCESNIFHKLSYKADVRKTNEYNIETYYGHIFNEVFH